jgi:hypothetical protein
LIAGINGAPITVDAMASHLLKPWILVGGVLLFCSFGAAPIRSVPVACNLVRLSHLVLWSGGSLFAIHAIAGV